MKNKSKSSHSETIILRLWQGLLLWLMPDFLRSQRAFLCSQSYELIWCCKKPKRPEHKKVFVLAFARKLFQLKVCIGSSSFAVSAIKTSVVFYFIFGMRSNKIVGSVNFIYFAGESNTYKSKIRLYLKV